MRRLLLSSCLAAITLALACKSAPPPAPTPVAPPSPPPVTAGLDLAAMDLKANPCDDFYRYACGGWVDSTEIPPDRSSWSRGFATIAERNELILRDLLKEIAEGKAPEGTPFAQQIGDFWNTCMDEAKLEDSVKELESELRKLDAVNDPKSLAIAVGKLHARGTAALFSFGSTQDFKDATAVIGQVDQGGLGLPDRDYYVKDDAKTKEIREAYQQHVAKMMELAGQAPDVAAKSAQTVMEVETALAKASLTNVERREPEKLYHRLERAGLKKAAPQLPWDDFFKAAGAEKVVQLNVTHPPFFAEVAKLARAQKPEAWRTYLKWHLVNDVVPALPKRFQDEHFQFMSKNLTGAKEDLPRWKKCVSYTDMALGEALAQPFVAKTFGADGKTTTSEMVAEVEKAFEKNLDSLAWMDAPTREKALEKVRKIVNKIGFPDRWRSYETLKVDKSSFLANLLASSQFETARDMAKIGKPVDKSEWFMTPPTVNAYYNPQLNEIVFPAGILQPPFFNREATYAVNYGAMGMVVGHEITHGFDDEGRKFDADGNLKEWWTEGSGKAFVERAACVKDQFDQEIAIDDLKVNGALTLGENVADLGGLKLAYAAMQETLKKHPEETKSRFTPAQSFFLGYAQSWCAKYRPERARMLANVDPHAPPFLRVNVPLRNLTAFSEAFQCKEGSKMVPAKPRCDVW